MTLKQDLIKAIIADLPVDEYDINTHNDLLFNLILLAKTNPHKRRLELLELLQCLIIKEDYVELKLKYG